MGNILVLGGTRFFGKRLVHKLIEAGEQVTIATRGRNQDPFGDRVSRIILERESYDSLAAASATQAEWDVVYDNICYSPNDAVNACRAFAGKTKRYIMTSTLSVYPFADEPMKEEVFDPYSYPIRYGSREDYTYDELKRLAEAVFFQEATFPVVAVRFPIVMGTDDYTQRLVLHIDRIRDGQPIGLPAPQASWSMITSEEAASFLFWLRDQDLTGPVNACSEGFITLAELLEEIERSIGKSAIIEAEVTESNQSPYGITGHFMMDHSKAVEAGYSFTKLAAWYPALVKELTQQPSPTS